MVYDNLSVYLLNNSLWMSWNIFLALIPFWLANHLFHPKRRVSIWWGFGVIFFILFLPNAPYIFTDLIHLAEAVNHITSPKMLIVATGQFLLLECIAFWLFVKSYRKFEKFILKKKYYPQRYWMRLVSFVTVSIGVYLGRFLRLNSWDAFTKPLQVVTTLKYLGNFQAIFFIIEFSILLLFLYIAHEKLWVGDTEIN